MKLLVSVLLITASLTANAANEEDSILEEVKRFYAGYVSAFTSKQAELLADKYLIAPFYFRNLEGSIFLGTKEDVSDYLVSAFSEMSSQDYESSQILTSSYCVLSDTSAIVSVAFRRFDSNGNVLLESGATYSLFKLRGQWRFAMLSTHAPENVVSCRH
jgi:hypothetical protein